MKAALVVGLLALGSSACSTANSLFERYALPVGAAAAVLDQWPQAIVESDLDGNGRVPSSIEEAIALVKRLWSTLQARAVGLEQGQAAMASRAGASLQEAAEGAATMTAADVIAEAEQPGQATATEADFRLLLERMIAEARDAGPGK